MIASNLFSNAKIEFDPYPHIIWDNLLDFDTFNELEKSMPKDLEFNHAVNILKSENTLWKSYVEYFTGIDFHKQILEIFGLEIGKTVGLRKRDIADYVTESFIAIRQPTNNDWCLYPHIDSKWAVTSMVHYFKSDDDTDDTGDFVILKPIKPITYVKEGPRIKFADPECFEIVKRIPYGRNNAICMLSGTNTWHGILPRKQNTRRTVNISYEEYN